MPRVYRYIAEPMTADDRAIVLRQFRLAGDYRRALAVVESGRRAAVNALLREGTDIADLEAELAAALAVENTERAAATAAALKTARAGRRKEQAYKDGVKEIAARQSPMVRMVRGSLSAAGLYWGTYLLVEDAHARAADGRDPWEPVLVRSGWSSIGVQAPRAAKTMTIESLRSGADTRATLSDFAYALRRDDDHYGTVAPVGWRNRSGTISPATWRSLRLRVGSNPDRSPKWARFHVRIEPAGARGKNMRQIPAGARIAMIKIVRVDTCYRAVFKDGKHVVEPRERWEVQFTVEDEVARSRPTGVGAVGFDIGWRRVDGGIRIASALTAGGAFTECIIPDSVLQLRQQMSRTRSAIDHTLNGLRAEIGQLRGETAPTWLMQATEGFHPWRRLGRWAACADAFTANGHPFGAVLSEHLRGNDARNRTVAHNLQRRQRLRIEGRVRAWIAAALKGHDVVGVEQAFRIDKMRTRTMADSEAAFQAATANPEIAAGNTRRWIKEMALSRGCRVVEVSPHNTTRLCPQCGVDRGPVVDLVATCAACGTAEDQDLTACREIRRRAVTAGDGELAAAVVKKIRRPRRAPAAAKETTQLT